MRFQTNIVLCGTNGRECHTWLPWRSAAASVHFTFPDGGINVTCKQLNPTPILFPKRINWNLWGVYCKKSTTPRPVINLAYCRRNYAIN